MAQSGKKPPKIPKPGAGTPEDLKRCVEYGIRHESAHRLKLFRLWEQCRLYYQGNQWLEQDSDRYTSGELAGRSPFWKPREVNANTWYPMPVQNEMIAPIQNEIARIYGSGSKAYVRPKSADAVVERAAKTATDVLVDALEKLNWEEKEHLAVTDLVLYGTMIVKTAWELDYTKTIKLPVQGACKCALCGCRMAKTEFEEEEGLKLFKSHPGAEEAAEEVVSVNPGTLMKKRSFKLSGCPKCKGPALEPYTSTDPEEMDDFDQPLNEDEAIGDVNVRVVSPYDFFPENDGVATTASEIGTFREEHVETLDWIRAHYKKGVEVKAETVDSMYRWHQGGIAGFTGGIISEDGLYDSHALVKELHKLPWVEVDENGVGAVNRGRSIVVANGVVLLDGDYLLPSRNNPGKFIPRVEYAAMPWEPRDRELFGISAGELILGLQDVVNTTLSQAQDARHRFGSPKILIEEGADIQYSGFLDTGYQSDVVTYRPSPGGAAPTLFGNTQMSGNWMTEIKMAIEAISRIIGTMDVEIGEAPKNLSAASAIMYLGEKAAERRKNRIARFKCLKRRIYRHILRLIHEFYREDRLYSVRGRNDKWEVRSFVGTDLDGQDDVWIEDEPYFDVRMFRREVIKDALGSGTITADSAAAKRRINKEWGVPAEINEETNNQVQQAEEEWLRFYSEQIQPAVCLRGDDHQIHFKTHELSFQQPEAKQLMREAQWNDCELELWGWEDQYAKFAQAEELLKSKPIEAGPDQPPAGPDGFVDPNLIKAAQQDFEQRQQISQQIQSIPKAPELRIQLVWTNTLAPLFSSDPTRWEKITQIVRFKAHSEAHYQVAQQQSMAVQGGMPIPAAPGGVETGTGNIPGNPVYAFPGAGSGPGATTAAGDGGVGTGGA